MESEKSFYKINEVCSMTGVKPYVLRFWEAEFARLSPILSSTGQRLYEFQHIQLIKQIKDLLFVKKLTIEKAKLEIDACGVVSSEDASKSIKNELPEVPQEEIGVELLPEEDNELTEIFCELESFSLEKVKDVRQKLNEILTKIELIESTHQWL